MNKKSWAAAVVIATAACAPAAFAADVGVSISVSQPGVYGRVDIGQFPQPQLVVAQPIVVMRPPHVAQPEPVYMWVPPGHRKKWSRYCGQYQACGVPVYFVQDRWYHEHVDRPRGPAFGRPGDGPGRGHDKGHGHGHGNAHDR